MLGERVVHRDDRVGEDALARHRAQPRDAGRRLLGPASHLREQLAALGVQLGDEVRAVVHGDLRTRREDGVDVGVVAVAVLALLREGRDALAHDERRRDVVLRGEGIRGAERDRRAAVAEDEHEVRRFGRDVEAGADPQIAERTLLREALADPREHRHLTRRPGDAPAAGFGEAEIGDIVLRWFCRHCHHFFSFRLPKSRSQGARRTAGPSMNGAWTMNPRRS